ncbi:MAG TPA: DUF2911 domain-containing protein [Candidatus Acidoferrum sp.]|nr:DUF2911 domain-containing protein [Candidatus Acidoferrum sp.]
MRIRFIAACALAIASVALVSLHAAPSRQQDPSQKPSPPASAKCELPGGGTITVDYSSPRMRGRKIYGGLVPWGKVWRAGANDATTFVPTRDVRIGNLDVPAGAYTIFVVPDQTKWALIVNKKTGEWGIPYTYESTELGRTEMKVSSISGPLENFTIGFDQSATGCKLYMDWETTRASVDITAKK